ncbi:hypothetical protein DNTS_009549 [Danionella cerebrum]|uniref:E3 ubiquitin-protein ligase n=1 Tax=Danionella cerebrum TaxID=2873325 RepID=A0A553Q532_9TELE|nr:hypothetical protein DNTS_009549 [Danionella translucida]
MAVRAEMPGSNVQNKKKVIKPGTQPDGGTLNWSIERRSLPGHPKCDTIQIIFHFEDGIQSEMHPHPGHRFRGSDTVAFLPQSTTGTRVLRLLDQAFQHRLLFTVVADGNSGEYCVRPADIPLKTRDTAGLDGLGYPDPSYMKTVKKCLAMKGIK